VKLARLLILTVAILLIATVPGWALKKAEQGVVVSFEGSINPRHLPRTTPAPIAVHVAGDFASASGDPALLPQLRQIKVGINRKGHLFDSGLPVCHAGEIQPATQQAARRICGDSIVGKGRVTVQVRLPAQRPFPVKARLLAFNGPLRHGNRLILAQVYARAPPGAFILVFEVERHPGTFGTVLTTRLPPGTRRWAYLTHFAMTLHRSFEYQGQRRSYVSAACDAPSGFTAAVFPFARVSYTFAEGTRIDLSTTETCRVAE
jgi:hypothetical protein